MMQREPSEEDRKIINSLVFRALRRVHAAGFTVIDIEDLRQEAYIAWCLARDSYDPSYGAKFGSYLYRGILQQFNTRLRHEGIQIRALSLDAPPRGNMVEDVDNSLHEAIANPTDKNLLELVVEKDLWQRTLKRLSPVARRVLELLESPPPALVGSLDELQARYAYARQRHLPSTAPVKRVTVSFILDAIGVPKADRSSIHKELKDAAQRIYQ